MPKPAELELPYEQRGLKIRQNESNRFVVCTLHYTADPMKDNPAWIMEARHGVAPAEWQMEMEIDYTAMFGQKVFPEFTSHRDKIVIRQPYPQIYPDQSCWAGLDFGLRNPTSFHVYTMGKNESGDRVIYAIWEHYEVTKSIRGLVETLEETCPYWDQLRWIAVDPALWKNDQPQMEGVSRIIDQMIKAGMRKVIKGTREQAPWMALMREHWYDLENREPTFQIFDNCPNMIREFETIVYSTMGDQALKRKNYKETMVDKDNHALDDCKYFMVLGPRAKPAKEARVQKRKRELWRRHAM